MKAATSISSRARLLKAKLTPQIATVSSATRSPRSPTVMSYLPRPPGTRARPPPLHVRPEGDGAAGPGCDATDRGEDVFQCMEDAT
ncbi:MAG: hypothetical protein A3I17_09915 [Candidatus Rokubacteria bacterium RIFCSPLOWO2_02_FULL_72_37]|nr:MAG: hypothetical protein A3I17_09915 [Candidatus Rokubacteria bacterium RIFCSPLOWO2_02_FULL_72_37]